MDRRVRVVVGRESDSTPILGILDASAIRISLPPDPRWQHQVLAVALVDLLGRLFPRIDVAIAGDPDAHPSLPPGPKGLLERLEAARANGGLELQASGPAPLRVVIGTSTEEADYYADGIGWQAYTGTAPSRLKHPEDVLNPIGPMTAACRVAAHVFSNLLKDVRSAPPVVPDVYASALDFAAGSDPQEVDAPLPNEIGIDALAVGAGSVGGAAIFALAFLPRLNGTLTIVDPEALEDKNLDRALLATEEATSQGLAKVEVARDALAHHATLEVTARQERVTDYHASLRQDAAFPLTVVSVDSAMARRAVQDCLPLEVVNAACSPDEVMLSGHRTGTGPCVCCLHMEDVLNRDAIKMRLISRATGFNEVFVAEMLVRGTGLEAPYLRHIEQHLGAAVGSLEIYAGSTLQELWDRQLLYGGASVEMSEAAVVVAAPFVTALAGFLLASEALKRATGLSRYALGPDGKAIKYVEAPYASPLHADLLSPTRWPGSECLCRSTRRLRIMASRYGLDAAGLM